MIRLTKKQILMFHSQLVKAYGGSDGIRDENLLESALESPFQSLLETFFETLVYMLVERTCVYGRIHNKAVV